MCYNGDGKILHNILGRKMKNKYKKIISIISIIILISLMVGIVFSRRVLIKSNNGYEFKCVGMFLYKVTDGDKYLGSICDFRTSNELIFQDEVYKYNLIGYEENYKLDIQYPDGGIRTETKSTNSILGVGSHTRYDTEFITAAILAVKLSPSPIMIISVIFIVLLGLGLLLYPNVLFELKYGWKFKNLEPSSEYLFFERVIGIVFILIGIYFMLK